MHKYELEFCFKGARTYVQGPDIFDKVVDCLKSDFNILQMTDIKYAAYDMLYTNADVIVSDKFDKNDFDKINSIITFRIHHSKYHAVVVENQNKIKCTTEYSEEIVRSQSKIKENIISFENSLDDSLTEIIVSMNKYFLQTTVPSEGKWIVTKFEYDNLIGFDNIKNKTLELELLHNFNNKLTKSAIKIGKEAVGYLYFSLI